MTTHSSYRALAVTALLAALPAVASAQAQNAPSSSPVVVASASNSKDSTKVIADSTKIRDSLAIVAKKKAAAKAPRYIVPVSEIQHLRPADQRGINVYESPKEEGVPFTGFKLNWGGAFTQQFQNLTHQNTAVPVLVANVDKNALIPIAPGFNNAVANVNLNVQLAKGVRVAVETYASARHHQETWVKDGYFLIDASPIDNALLDQLMQYVTLKVGHFEINYGDQHFRRTDNGQS